MARFRARTRRPRRKTAWLEGIRGGCTVPLTVRPCNDFETAPQSFLVVDNPAAVIPGDVTTATEATVVRIVGELIIFHGYVASAAGNSSIAVITTWMGIAIQDIPLQGTFVPLHPFLDNQSKDWLWRGTFWSSDAVLPGGTTLDTKNNMEHGNSEGCGAHIDIRVKRKLREQEAIVLNVFTTVDHLSGSSFGTDAELNGNVRALIELH